jgi:hypothetical protein
VLFVVGLAGLVVALVYTFWWTRRAHATDDTRVMHSSGRPPYA